MSRLRILWADDQTNVQRALSLSIQGFEPSISYVRSGDEALRLLTAESVFDLVILDLKMPPGTWGGLWLLEEMRRLEVLVPAIVVSGEGTQTETIKALRLGAVDYVTKDRVQDELSQRIVEVIEKSSTETRLRRLIYDGESNIFECKETLRWNIQAAKFDRIPEYAVAKTIAAFANTDGGVLAIGVRDTGEIVGLHQDRFEDNDATLRHLDNVLQNYIGNTAAPLIHAQFARSGEKHALLVTCRKSSDPVYVRSGKGDETEFYIRRQASSVKLPLDQAIPYISSRFGRSGTYPH